jgi:PAS domain S-box-containing protein
MRARALAQPVIALSRAAEDLAAGRLQADLPVTGTDEVGELTRAFNSMRHSVQQAQTDLREANRTLEQRVQERTAALQESEMRFRTMVETAPNGILIYDAEKDRFVEANTRSCELIGYTREELMQKSWTDISAASQPDGRPAEDKIKPLVEEALEGRPRFQEWVLVHSKGQKILVEMWLNPIFFAGRRLIRASLADINERRQLELQLQQALKLEAVGTLAGGIAHEFNNILSIILGNAELAKEFVNASTPVRANMEEIIAACLRGRDVVHGLLSFSRKSEHKKMAVDIVPIIKETLKLLRSSLPANIEIRQEISNQSCIIMADPTQIHQVMINLGTNAAHAMESGGTLTVGLRAETFEPGSILPHAKLNPGSYVHLWVHDTGRGIEPENLDRIFDPFFTTKDVSKGTGLGLAVVMGIVDNHKASIFVKSQPGQGTAFDVYFPAIESFTPEPVLRPQALPGGKERILFIDDEKSIAEIAQVLLERLGYSVNSITDPIKALELFEKDPDSIDLVITDLSMPHVTGEQLAIRMLRRKPDLPIILVSGYSDRMNKQRAEELGIRLYIQKPLDRRKLAFAVRQILDQEHNPT